jgi:hypothetical protein
MARNLEKRLAKAEQELAQIQKEEELADCICPDNYLFVTAESVEEFRAEMNRVCPVHGFRRLNIFRIIVEEFDPDFSSSAEVEDTEFQELLDEYHRRLVEAKELLFED